MAYKIVACVVLFNIVVAVPVKNNEINTMVTEQNNLQMASPSYIRSLDDSTRYRYLDRSIYNVPIPTNLNSNYRHNAQIIPPQEPVVSNIHYSILKKNQGTKELQLPPSHKEPQDKPNTFQTVFSENSYQNINNNNWESPILKQVINALHKQNVNRKLEEVSQKPDQTLQAQGSSTLQYIMSNPSLIRSILSPRPKVKQYTLVYPNGTIGYEDNLDMIESRYPNHILINARDLQELTSAGGETKVASSLLQENLKKIISSTKSDYSKSVNNTPSNNTEQNSESKSTINQVNKNTNSLTFSDTGIKSIISNLSEINSSFHTETDYHEGVSSIHRSNSTKGNITKVRQNVPQSKNRIELKTNSTKQEVQKTNREVNQSDIVIDENNMNSIIFSELSSSKETNSTDLSINSKMKGTGNIKPISAVNDELPNNTVSLVKEDISTLNITNNTNIVISPVKNNYLKNSIHNDSTENDTQKDDLDTNISYASNASNATTEDYNSNGNDTENGTTEQSVNMNNNLNDDFMQSNILNNVTGDTLFDDSFNIEDSSDDILESKINETNDSNTDEEYSRITIGSDILQSQTNETNGTNTDEEYNLSAVVDSLDENETSQGGSWVHSQVFEDGEEKSNDDVSENNEDSNKNLSKWLKIDKENFTKMLFDEGIKNVNFMFYNPPKEEVEKETKTTIYPNGTIVEEYIETRKDLDGGPTIKTIIMKTYDVGVDRPSDRNCNSSER